MIETLERPRAVTVQPVITAKRRDPGALLVVGIVLLGAILRLWHFPHVPAGMNQDEAGAAYEAWSLLKTGADKWGNPICLFISHRDRGKASGIRICPFRAWPWGD